MLPESQTPAQYFFQFSASGGGSSCVEARCSGPKPDAPAFTLDFDWKLFVVNAKWVAADPPVHGGSSTWLQGLVRELFGA